VQRSRWLNQIAVAGRIKRDNLFNSAGKGSFGITKGNKWSRPNGSRRLPIRSGTLTMKRLSFIFQQFAPTTWQFVTRFIHFYLAPLSFDSSTWVRGWHFQPRAKNSLPAL